MRRASFDLFVSEAVVKEASGGDESAARQRLDEIEDIPLLTLTADVAALAEKLVKELSFARKSSYRTRSMLPSQQRTAWTIC